MLELLQCMLHLGTATVHVTSWSCYSSCYMLELLQFMLHLGTAKVHVTCWNCYSSCYILELLQCMLHLGTATVHVTSWNCYSACYFLELLWTATVHVTSWNILELHFLELLQFMLHLGTSWNCYSSCYRTAHLGTAVTSWNFLGLLQFMLHLEGCVTSSRTTPGETVYHIGWHCFRWEKLQTITEYSKQKCNTYCSKMTKLRAPILFSQLSQDIYPIDGDCILSCKAKRKTKLITCTVEQVTGC